jgi:hypothetical protein
MARFGISEITDDLLEQEVLVRVSAGVGSPDPMQQAAKMMQAIDMLLKVLQGSMKFKTGALQLNDEQWINEIMGIAGHRDGFDRFFITGPPLPQPGAEQPQPENGMTGEQELVKADADRKSKEGIERLKSKTAILKDLIGHAARQGEQARQQQHEGQQILIDTLMEARNQRQQANDRAQDRTMRAAQAAQRQQRPQQQQGQSPQYLM